MGAKALVLSGRFLQLLHWKGRKLMLSSRAAPHINPAVEAYGGEDVVG